MKLYTSKESFVSFVILCGMILIYTILDICVCFYGGHVRELTLVIISTMVLIMFIIVVREYSFISYTLKEGTNFESYLFKRKLCTVHTGRNVYYKIFEAYEGGRMTQYGRWRKYIIFSNEPFKYEHMGSGLFCDLRNYDKRKQILIPYDEDIKTNFLDMEYWYAIKVD